MIEKEAMEFAQELLAEAAEKGIYGQVVFQFVEGRIVLGRIEETRKPPAAKVSSGHVDAGAKKP